MKIWPTSRQALVMAGIMFVNIFWSTDRFRPWAPNKVAMVATAVWVVIFFISLARERKGK